MFRTVSIGDDVIDSRDIIARLEELQDERQTLIDAVEEARDDLANMTDTSEEAEGHADGLQQVLIDAEEELQEWNSEFAVELHDLQEFDKEARDATSEYTYGATFIHDSYFEDYARELAEDIGAVDRNAKWPNNCIDWDQAASELQADYTQIDVAGETYWTRD